MASQLNYLDRQTFSVLASTLQKQFGMTDMDYSVLTMTFLWTYAVAYLFSGYIVDILGTRRSFLVFASGWSAADMLHACARSFAGLAVCRAGLALMEPANFPAGIKAVTEWFPVRERALAVAICNSGTGDRQCAGGAGGGVFYHPVWVAIGVYRDWRAGVRVGDILGGSLSQSAGTSATCPGGTQIHRERAGRRRRAEWRKSIHFDHSADAGGVGLHSGAIADGPDFLLPLFLDAEVSARRAGIRFETGGAAGVDSICGADGGRDVQRADAALAD